MGGTIIRRLTTLAELVACIRLQQRIWGYADSELYPLRLLVTIGKIGGHVLGAFIGRHELVGFVASMPAWREGRRYFHSLSLGVHPRHENRGVGRALKLAQRRAALKEGIELIEWTFDPLRAKNAFFNLVRLGAIVRRYLPDHYGRVESRLQQGLPSDRLVAEWWLKSPRVRRALDGKPPRTRREAPRAEVAIRAGIGRLALTDRSRARAVQAEVRRRLRVYFDRGLAITDFSRENGPPRYLLDPLATAGIPGGAPTRRGGGRRTS